MLIPSFPDMPAFNAFLSGSRDIGLFSVLCEVGRSDGAALDRWRSRLVADVLAMCPDRSEGRRLAAAATGVGGVTADAEPTDGRLCAILSDRAAWPAAVAAAEERVLCDLGLSASIVSVCGDLLIRVDLPSGPLFHPVGSLSVWVEPVVAVGFLVERFGVDPLDAKEALENPIPVSHATRRQLIQDYLERLDGSEMLALTDLLTVRRQLAALEPGELSRWLGVAEAHLIAGEPLDAYRLASRLERAGLRDASFLRRESASVLSKLN